MKKILCTLLAVSLLIGAVWIPVSADPVEPENDGVYAITPESGYTLTALNGSDTAIVGVSAKISDSVTATDFCESAVKMQLTYTPTANEQQLVLLLAEHPEAPEQVKGGGTVVPQQDDIKYIWQDAVASGNITFDIYPDWDNLDEGSYGVYVASSSKGLEKVAGFEVYNAYVLGNTDLSSDKKIDVSDVLLALQHAVHKSLLTGKAFKAGDIDKSGEIDVSDVLLILQRAVGKIEHF